jgi:23S rRNA (cytidine2498-2'-O)-methyltransferase
MLDDQLILTASPDFADLALRELEDVVEHTSVLGELAEGVYWIQIVPTFWDLAEQWRLQPPIFVRHICPVQVVVPLRGQPADLDALRNVVAADIAPLIDPDLPFSIQSRTLCDLPYQRFDINNALADVVQSDVGAPLNVREPIQIVSVLCAETPGQEADCSALIGVSLAAHNLSDWAGGMRRFAREKGQVSRSEFKLLEALEVFHITLPPRGVALDLGAAPGGWSRVLRRLDQYVTAVDPGELHPSIAADRSVRHIRTTAEAYLADEPDTFDVIVNDMRMDAPDSARLMVGYAQHLYADGLALVTLKLPEQNRNAILDEAFAILRRAYTIAGGRQLFHNRSEVTVHLTRKP